MARTDNEKSAAPYRFVALDRERIDMAYALVRDSDPPVSLNQWRGYAQALLDEDVSRIAPRGIIVAEAPADYIRGIFAYHVCPDLPLGNRLDLDCIAVPEAFDRRAIANALIDQFNSLARHHDCRGVVTHLRHDQAWLDPFFRTTGYGTSELQMRSLQSTVESE